jgi:hypothetical protein
VGQASSLSSFLEKPTHTTGETPVPLPLAEVSIYDFRGRKVIAPFLFPARHFPFCAKMVK